MSERSGRLLTTPPVRRGGPRTAAGGCARRRLLRPVLELLLLTLAASAAAAAKPTDPADSLTAAQRARLAAGEVVVLPPREDDPEVAAAVRIAAAPPAVWRVMVDCEAAPEYVPGMRACRVLEERGDVSLIEHRVKVTSLLPELTYVFRVDHRPYERISFRRVAGSLREMTGDWRLRPDGQGTLVTYSVVLDPGVPVPDWVIRRALTRDLPELLEALKQRVEGEETAAAAGAGTP